MPVTKIKICLEKRDAIMKADIFIASQVREWISDNKIRCKLNLVALTVCNSFLVQNLVANHRIENWAKLIKKLANGVWKN